MSPGHHTNVAYGPSLWPVELRLSNSLCSGPRGEWTGKEPHPRALEDNITGTLMFFPSAGAYLLQPL